MPGSELSMTSMTLRSFGTCMVKQKSKSLFTDMIHCGSHTRLRQIPRCPGALAHYLPNVYFSDCSPFGRLLLVAPVWLNSAMNVTDGQSVPAIHQRDCYHIPILSV